MKEWNNNFDMKRKVNGKTITIGEQDFMNGTIMVKEEDGNIINLPMLSDEDGNFYFTYNNMGVYVSDYMGNFPLVPQ